MPPRYLRRLSPERLKPCQERMVEACDIDPSDGCCGVIPCKLCIEWQAAPYDIAHASSDFGTSSWTGTVSGISFLAYWQRNSTSGRCEFLVFFDGEEVYRATCYEGASCRDPQGEVEVSTAYLDGILRWRTYEPRELELIDSPETGCRDHFCGNCRCTCKCLCVAIQDSYGTSVASGEICDIAYDCDPPTWLGTVGEYLLSLTLGRDQYGECVITPTINGDEQAPVAAAGCAAITATIVVEATGDVITLTCKACCCDCGGSCVGCCFCNQSPATNVDYEISAPNCSALDGITGNISGPDTGTATGCGSCVSLPNNSQFHEVPTFVWDDSIPSNGCVPQPGANFQFRFLLKCDENQPNSETDSATTDPCCRNVRLLVVDANTDGIRLEIPPLSCSCSSSGIMAIFPINKLYEDCTSFYSGGVCDGRPTCAQIGDGPGGSCSLAGATLTITQTC